MSGVRPHVPDHDISVGALDVQVRVGVVLGHAPQPSLFVPEDLPAQVLGEERGDAGRGVRGGEVGHAVLLAWRDEATDGTRSYSDLACHNIVQHATAQQYVLVPGATHKQRAECAPADWLRYRYGQQARTAAGATRCPMGQSKPAYDGASVTQASFPGKPGKAPWVILADGPGGLAAPGLPGKLAWVTLAPSYAGSLWHIGERAATAAVPGLSRYRYRG